MQSSEFDMKAQTRREGQTRQESTPGREANVKIRLVLTEIQPFENVKIYKEMYGHPDAVRQSVRMAIHFFVNFEVFKSLYLSQN